MGDSVALWSQVFSANRQAPTSWMETKIVRKKRHRHQSLPERVSPLIEFLQRLIIVEREG
jgi:hypothetical protein